MPDPLTMLVELEALKRLKARYFRYLDTKDWESWHDLFTQDVRLAGLSQPFTGLDEFIRTQRENLQNAVTVHHGHTPDLELTGPTTARGYWAMSDYLEFPANGERRGVVGYGYYEEEYRKEVDVWKISFLRLYRIRMDPVFGDPLPPFQHWTTTPEGKRVPPGRQLV